jgi:hypothetical protein
MLRLIPLAIPAAAKARAAKEEAAVSVVRAAADLVVVSAGAVSEAADAAGA